MSKHDCSKFLTRVNQPELIVCECSTEACVCVLTVEVTHACATLGETPLRTYRGQLLLHDTQFLNCIVCFSK